MFFQAGEVALDGVADVGKSLRARRALRNAAGQVRAFDDEHAVFILLDQDAEAKCHAVDYLARHAEESIKGLGFIKAIGRSVQPLTLLP